MKRCLFLVVFLVLSLAGVGHTNAGCRRATCNYVQTYATPYVAPYVAPYVYTSYLAVPVPVYPIYGVGYGSPDLSELTNIRAELTEIRKVLTPPTPPVGPLRRDIMPQAEPVPAPAPAPGPATTALTFDRPKMISIVQQSCAKCHGPNKQEAKLSLLSADGKSLAILNRETLNLVFRKVARGDMPKGGPPISQEALDLFDQWAESVK